MSGEEKILELLEAFKIPAIYTKFDEKHQKKIIETLREFGIVELLKLVEDKEEDLKKAAIFALGYIGDERAVSPLKRVIAEELFGYDVAILALINLEGKRAIEPLLILLRQHYISATVKQNLAEALESL